MKIFKSSENPPIFSGTSIAIGKFDGVHLGHQKLLKDAVANAKKDGLTSVAITFNPHPMKIIAPHLAPEPIIPFEDRYQHIFKQGVDAVYVIEFDEAYAQMTAKDFIRDVLVEMLKAKHVHVGSNFRFGHMAMGDATLLQVMDKKLGFKTHPAQLVLDAEGVAISSKRIRQAIADGDHVLASTLLGYDFPYKSA